MQVQKKYFFRATSAEAAAAAIASTVIVRVNCQKTAAFQKSAATVGPSGATMTVEQYQQYLWALGPGGDATCGPAS